MCGICGVAIPAASARSLDEARLITMRDVLHHRGPDDAGVFLEPGIGLGHRRLSIVDLAGGHQPMASADGRHVLVYNGEVYNHPALMPRLQAEGMVYRTHSDTETILHLVARHGREVVHHLRGMFAFAAWDRATRTLTLARDRFGVKPLYYWLADDGTLVFGSEIKAVLASGMVRATLNHAALPDYLANHAPSGEETLFAGIRRLPPGHTLTWRDGRVELARYWDLTIQPEEHPGRSDADLTAEWLERFREAVRLRLMADVPLGMFLSGGIDSAAITAVMSDLVEAPIRTFSVAFAEREANELAYARLVAERFRTVHHEVVVSPAEFWGMLPRLVWHEDEPIAHPSSIPLHFVSRLAAEHVKVVLTGEGSDEMLAGYNRYRVTAFNHRLATAWQRMMPGPFRGGLASAIRHLPASSAWARRLGRTFLARSADLDALYFDNFAVFDRAWLGRLLAPEAREATGSASPYAAFHRALERTPQGTALLDQLLYADVQTYLHELLMKQDQMSMAASIESRVPFLDHPLTEFTATLPHRLKLHGTTTKVILRRAMHDTLPSEILARRKMGFPVPVGRWLREADTGLLDEFLLSPRARARGLFDPAVVTALVAAHRRGEPGHDERLWSLVNLEVWQRIFLDGEAPAPLATPGAG